MVDLLFGLHINAIRNPHLSFPSRRRVLLDSSLLLSATRMMHHNVVVYGPQRVHRLQHPYDVMEGNTFLDTIIPMHRKLPLDPDAHILSLL